MGPARSSWCALLALSVSTLAALALASGCTSASAAAGPDSVACSGEGCGKADEGSTAGDADGDGIADAIEEELVWRHAPILKLPLDEDDWTRPGNVDFYMERVTLRFSHTRCFDHEIVALGELTEDALPEQEHRTTGGLLCRHTNTIYASSDNHPEYFLHAPDEATRSGSDPSEWRAYAHARKSTVVADGIDIQYWFFYPYQWTVPELNINHEGDWEHITVTVREDQTIESVWFAQHAIGERRTPDAMELEDGERPVVYVAGGTHASYPEPGTYEPPDSRWYAEIIDIASEGGPVWDTRQDVVNVGERGKPLHGQSFIRYGGRWGQIGLREYTSGPQTPTFQRSWDDDAPPSDP